MIIAGIGSRQITSDIEDACIRIGKYCRDHKIWVRSGHAEGSDWAFERGAQEFCITYLPWLKFNENLKSSARYCVPALTQPLMDLVRKFHPNPSALSRGAMSLMARNGCQILGTTLKSPVDAVVCYTRDGKFSGGTGQALRIAQHHNIPIFNLYSIYVPDVIEELIQIRRKLDGHIGGEQKDS